MSKNDEGLKTIKGYIVPLPLGKDDAAARVAVAEGDVEYHILPRGAGADLGDYINAYVEVDGVLREMEGVTLVQVRNYRLQDAFDHEWYDDEA